MIERSIQSVGNSSLTVSLPKQWAQKYGLKSKSKVYLMETPNGLITIMPKKRIEKKITLNLNNDPELAVKLLIAAYLDGYDSVEFSSEGSTILEPSRMAVRNTVKRLIGFEILRETPTAIEVELVAELKPIPFEDGLSRMSKLIESAIDLGLSSAINSNSSTLDDVDEDADRLNFVYLRRLRLYLINPVTESTLNIDHTTAIDLITVFKVLERCVDHSVALSKIWLQSASTLDENKRAQIKQLADLSLVLLKLAVDSFIKKDVTKATYISKQRGMLKNKEFSLEQYKSLDINPLIIYHLSRLIDYSADIAETVLNEGYGFLK